MSRDRMLTVLRLRTLHEQRARTAMGAAAVAVAEAERARDGALDAMRERRMTVAGIGALRLARSVDMALTEAVEQAATSVAAAKADHERAAEEWRVRRAEERAVERLVERRAEQARLEAMAAEQVQMDEMAIIARSRGAA